jgi:Uma2 family endonuclease
MNTMDMEVVAPVEIGMPLDEFLEAMDSEPFELIDGERIIKMPNVLGPGKAIQALFVALFIYVQQNRLGRVFNEITFILPGKHGPKWVKGSRIPDVMFYAGTRFEDYEAQTPDANLRPIELIPDLVVEVVSPTDKYTDVNRKVEVYLKDGVRLIWVIDPQVRTAMVYAPGQPIIMLNEDDVLRGGDVVPGFEMMLKDVFA